MTDRELMQQALDCLLAWKEESSGYGWSISDQECVEELRARLAQPEPEPVAWMHDSHVGFNVPLYTAPPQREWQDLTDDESDEIWGECLGVFDCLRMTQAKLKGKNG